MSLFPLSRIGNIANFGPQSGAAQMAFDLLALQYSIAHATPVFRLYQWRTTTVTFGRFYPYHDAVAHFPNLPLARRPTGGGAVLHQHDFTFSIASPGSRTNGSPAGKTIYLQLHEILKQALQAFLPSLGVIHLAKPDQFNHAKNPPNSLCFAAPVENDLLWKNQKIAGGALYRNRYGWLYQGCIRIHQPDANSASADFTDVNLFFSEFLLRELARNVFTLDWHEVAQQSLPELTEILSLPLWLEHARADGWLKFLNFAHSTTTQRPPSFH
ncbi:MAG: hypothetical protein N2035_06275 [Chthoniobacterales bacterium]|nr:hypothetical protein [Chthoniobacterales bacterium]